MVDGKNNPEWIHTPDDGRGARLVFIAGVLQKGMVIFADTKRMYAKIAREDNPLIYDIVRGHVTVIPHP